MKFISNSIIYLKAAFGSMAEKFKNPMQQPGQPMSDEVMHDQPMNDEMPEMRPMGPPNGIHPQRGPPSMGNRPMYPQQGNRIPYGFNPNALRPNGPQHNSYGPLQPHGFDPRMRDEAQRRQAYEAAQRRQAYEAQQRRRGQPSRRLQLQSGPGFSQLQNPNGQFQGGPGFGQMQGPQGAFQYQGQHGGVPSVDELEHEIKLMVSLV